MCDAPKTFIKPSEARAIVGEATPVAVQWMYAFEKFDDMGIVLNKGRFQILFYPSIQNSHAGRIVWRFENQADRNAVFSQIECASVSFM